jgi:hypothetical protein
MSTAIHALLKHIGNSAAMNGLYYESKLMAKMAADDL